MENSVKDYGKEIIINYGGKKGIWIIRKVRNNKRSKRRRKGKGKGKDGLKWRFSKYENRIILREVGYYDGNSNWIEGIKVKISREESELLMREEKMIEKRKV